MNSTSVPPIAVSIPRAAEMLDCSRQHIYQLCERGVLRRQHITGSRAVRIPVTDLYQALGLTEGVPADGRVA